MKSLARAVGFCAVMLCASAAQADPAGEARALYDRFVAAENASDFEAVKTTLLDSPRFLWVTNGLSIWGRDAAIKRMSEYHKAEVWHIVPDYTKAVGVEVNSETSFLHVPLELEIGSKADGPDHFRFLISALCVATPDGWRIAALFTTPQNTD
jgi:ketosteroid isomerase-like protein